MKRFSFLQVVVLALLTVTVVSCSVPMGAADDYYEDTPARRNSHYGDPYYGGVNTIIVERDPYTGRYYQVSPGPYGGVYSAPAYGYGRRPAYGNGRVYNNRNYNTNRNNGYYRAYPQTQKAPQRPVQQRPVQQQPTQQERQNARDAILGKSRN